MPNQRLSPARRLSFTVLIAALVALTGCAQTAGAPVEPDHAAQAWTDRLNGLAQAASDRPQGEAQLQRANEAYSQRLSGQARAYREEQARGRANQAWTDRLNGLAEYLNASR
jgi:outer membrane biogenesis lipoprotein LolB